MNLMLELISLGNSVVEVLGLENQHEVQSIVKRLKEIGETGPMLDSFGFPLFAAKYFLKNVFCWFPMKLHAFTHLLIFL